MDHHRSLDRAHRPGDWHQRHPAWGALTNHFNFTNNPESKRADKLLEERLRGPRRVNEVVVVQSQTLEVNDQAFRDLVEELYGEIVDQSPT